MQKVNTKCSILLNSSKLPTNLAPRTDQSLTSVHFSQDDILKIIQNLNPNKAHGPDKISIRMIKICGKSLCKPLEMIFKSCIKKGEYPSEWKKANVVPVHKKGDKQLLKNYRPISLLPIFGKIFERIIYNNIFEYLTTNKLISDNQSGFKPGDSCVGQLLSITHEIYHSLDNGLEVRGVFLDISKAFDKVWHERLILKLNQYGISENLLRLIKCFLKHRKQRVALNGQTSSWTNVLAGVPQGSILGPLFFLIYINDLSDDLSSNPKLFADDTSLFSVVYDINTSTRQLNNEFRKISNLAYQWKMSFNSDPLKQAQEEIFSRKMTKTNHPILIFNDNPVHQVALQKHLGMFLDCKLNFEEHLKTIINKIIKTIGLLRKFQNFLPRKSLLTIYKSFIRPHFDYGDIIYDQTYNTSFHQRLESLQYNAALAITGAIRGTSKEKLYNGLGLESLQNRRWYRKLSFLYKVIANKSPSYLFNMTPTKNTSRPTQETDNTPLLGTKHNFFLNSYFPAAIKEWNRLDIDIRKSDSISIFKKRILSFIGPLPN